MKQPIIKYGVLLFIGLMAFFLLMRSIGYGDRYDFRVLNVIIQVALIYLSIRSYARTHPEDFDYLTGTMVGVFTTLVGVIPFALFHMINLTATPQIMTSIQETAPVIGPYLNPFTAGLIILAEGTSVGIVLSYICMRIVDWREVSANKPYVPHE